MGRKCQMFINVIRATLKNFEWFPDFVVSICFLYECSHLIKYLFTELGRSVRTIFCPLHRPRRSVLVCKKTWQNIPSYRPPAGLTRLALASIHGPSLIYLLKFTVLAPHFSIHFSSLSYSWAPGLGLVMHYLGLLEFPVRI